MSRALACFAILLASVSVASSASASDQRPPPRMFEVGLLGGGRTLDEPGLDMQPLYGAWLGFEPALLGDPWGLRFEAHYLRAPMGARAGTEAMKVRHGVDTLGGQLALERRLTHEGLSISAFAAAGPALFLHTIDYEIKDPVASFRADESQDFIKVGGLLSLGLRFESSSTAALSWVARIELQASAAPLANGAALLAGVGLAF